MPASSVARQAQEQTDAQVAAAQVRLLCFDATGPWTDWHRERLAAVDPACELVVLTKVDVAAASSAVRRGLSEWAIETGPISDGPISTRFIETSAATGTGLDRLLAELALRIRASLPELPAVAATALRAAESLKGAAAALARARGQNEQRGRDELIAAEVRGALVELGKVSGGHRHR